MHLRRSELTTDMAGSYPNIGCHRYLSEVTDSNDERSTNTKYSSTAAITMNDWRVDGNSSSESAFPQWQQYRY